MRPGQNRRMRGRNSNRKGPNPLTRSFESNGPDVKIRGTAQHIAEKYSQLARDAQASGDPVAAENYLQHAEHYYRIVAAAQAQFPQSYGGFQRPFDEGADDGEGDEEINGYGSYAQQPGVHEPGAPQPDVRMPVDDGYSARQPYRESGRGENGRGDYAARAEDGRGEEGARTEGGRSETGSAPREGARRERFRRGTRAAAKPQPEADEAADTGLPAFLTTPVRQSAASEAASGDEAEFPAQAADGDEAGRFPLRTRRRRGRPRAERPEGEASNGNGGEHSGSEAAPVD